MKIVDMIGFDTGSVDYILDNGWTLTVERAFHGYLVSRAVQDGEVKWHCSNGTATVPHFLKRWITSYNINPDCTYNYVSSEKLTSLPFVK